MCDDFDHVKERTTLLPITDPVNALYYDAPREIYEAWMLYNFLALLLAYIGYATHTSLPLFAFNINTSPAYACKTTPTCTYTCTTPHTRTKQPPPCPKQPPHAHTQTTLPNRGPGAVETKMAGTSLKPSLLLCTCFLPPLPVNGAFVKTAKRFLLQFVFIKPVLVLLKVMLYATGHLEEGNWSPTNG